MADVPIVLAGKAGVLKTFLAGQNIPALLSKGAPESLGGAVRFPENEIAS